ncbi:aspartic protease 7, partial [Aphelenchoides avenae]
FGALSVPEMPFILANSTHYPLNPRWASDGILPLGLVSGEALQKVFGASGGTQEVSLFLNNAKPSDNRPVPGGRIKFGGKNTQDCGDKWVTMNGADTTRWLLALNRLSLGNRRISIDDIVQLSTSTPFLEVPQYPSIRPFVKILGGKFNDEMNLYMVDCAKVDSFPSISISVGSGFGLAYTVKAQDYIAKI